ncbi:hypothetical protein HELRODRAFT_191009 [Helobdella robusta]|uniref:Rab proteins geranylgeranyltransferase component A n=1 Tax=Helobdella robusta TaxID=6412 RepID=T1FSH8_HELRO|nr:hypothetical protein HELRODRAFT_191009 [Helobdella robusta]ESO07677.1 hypothetical protein HELRODRAFT_191009 [Helobdella robusta]
MSGDQLPSENDVILYGSGLTESIISASLSRVEQKVLHVDCFDFYGGCWASFNLRSFRKLVQSKCSPQLSCPDVNLEKLNLKDGERFVDLFKQPEIITTVVEDPEICEKEIKDELPSTFWMKSNTEPTVRPEQETVDLNRSIISEANTSFEEEAEPSLPASEEKQGKTFENHEDVLTSKEEGKPDEEVCLKDSSNESAHAEDGKDVCGKKAEDVCEKKAGDVCGEEANDATLLQTFNVSVDDVVALDRKFNIDLVSKLLYNRGCMVELLISSDVARYCEFKIVSRILTLLDGNFQTVPCSKSDVFATTAVGVFEKRLLMKFLSMALIYTEKPEEYEGFESKKFSEFLEHKKLTRLLKHYVQYAIAMVDDDATTLEGLEATRKYLESLGRYGNSSFLLPLYGVGELVQCFCRLSAVFGGVYCLNRYLAGVVVDSNDNVVSVVDSNGERLSTKWLVVDPMYVNENYLPSVCRKRMMSRVILITDKSVVPDADSHITLCNVAVQGGKNIIMQEFSSLSQACPDHYYMVHLTCETRVDAHTDLSPFVKDHFHSSTSSEMDSDVVQDKPKVLWAVYFNIAGFHVVTPATIFNNVLITSNPNANIDCDRPIHEAECVFKRICLDQAFLPKAPRPEEIIFCEDPADRTSDQKNDDAELQSQPNAETDDVKKEFEGEGKEVIGDSEVVKAELS